LLLPRIRKARGNLEAAAALTIKEGGKHRWRVEMWKRQEVNRAVHAYQGYRMQITNHTIVFDGLIIRGWHFRHGFPFLRPA
jgi:hypothetical protein